MEGQSETLFNRYGGKIMRLNQLPLSAQKAIDEYCFEGGRPDDADELKLGYVMIPIDVLMEVCWDAPDNQMRDDYADWDSYHEEYWSVENDADYANHLREMWPVILDDGEGIVDGWHRLHWYFRNGVKQVPAILFVEQSVNEAKKHRKRRKHNALVRIGYGFYYGGGHDACHDGATTSAAPSADAGGGDGGGGGAA